MRVLSPGGGRTAAGLALAFALVWGGATPSESGGADPRKHEIHFSGTRYELHVYRVQGREPGGPTMLIIGGIQGDEPGGFLAADRYVDLSLRKGNLILVPRANFYSILKNNRGAEGDMNRRFRDGVPQNAMDRIVEILKGLMAEADIFLNLHDGSGFYSPQWEGPNRNPMRFGQSIIADSDVYADQVRGKPVFLEELARRVIDRVNAQIQDPRHHFHFNNHRTMEKNTRHAEQRASATYYALTQHGIPAFGVETSKEIRDHRVRVQYQTMVINAFLAEMGILPDHPPMTFDLPRLQYLLVSVNQRIPVAVPDRGSLTVSPDDTVQVDGVMANYQRGITADVEGFGSENDLQKPLRVNRDTRVLVRKESEVFGQIQLRVRRGGAKAPELEERMAPAPRVHSFILEVNGEKKLVDNHSRIRVIRGDRIRVVDVLTEGVAPELLKVNFIGFLRDGDENSGEDRGALIRTDSDLWPRYAVDEGGSRYRVVALDGSLLLGEMVVELEPPRLGYLVVGEPGVPRLVFPEGARIMARSGEEIWILEVKSNVPDNQGVSLQFRGEAAILEKADEGWVLRVTEQTPPAGEIEVSRDGIPMGRVLFERM